MTAACTVVSPNYLAFARVLSASYLAHHPGDRFFVLIVADTSDPAPFAGSTFEPVLLGEIGLPELRAAAMRYDILELNTNVKPAFLQYLFQRYALEAVVYLDPDIAVYAPLSPVFDLLRAGASAVLTPHITEPVEDGCSPSEQDHLYNGTYNLGFVALRRGEETDRLLAWWSARCLMLGFSEGRTGLFVDQKWMNLAPGLFAGVAILRDAGCNVAYWNLQERRLETTGGTNAETYLVNEAVPLRFFHFSGIDPENAAQLSRNTDRFTLADRPDLHALFAEYRVALARARGTGAETVAYGFDRLSDGTVITRLARRIFSVHEARWRGSDPFDAAGPFARFARRLGLVAGRQAPGKNTWREFDPRDRRVLAVHRLLRAALRLLGPNRYELLMRYLAHIAVLRHQGVFLGESTS